MTLKLTNHLYRTLSVLILSAVLMMSGLITAQAAPAPTGPGLSAAAVGTEESYLAGASMVLVADTEGGQNCGVIVRTAAGSLIVVDGGRPMDTAHVTDLIRAMGGRVSLWLCTHPHDDHIGVLTELLRQVPCPVEIDRIAFHYLDAAQYEAGEHQGRMDNLYSFLGALNNHYPAERVSSQIGMGDTFRVDDVTVRVLNNPMVFDYATFNNSSLAFRLDFEGAGKKALFLGDLGPEAGREILARAGREAVDADIVQMAHHGQRGVDRDFYAAVSPAVCLWPASRWLYNNEKDGVYGAGPYATLETRAWMQELGVKRNLVAADGDQILR